MNKHQMLTIIIIANAAIFIIASLIPFGNRVEAAPPLIHNSPATLDSGPYFSVSALGFTPVSQNVPYLKDYNQQLLALTGQNRNFTADNNRFVVPLTLPDQRRLTGLTVFGQDWDNLGEVRLRLKRCDHNQPRCLNLAETSSDLIYNAGLFEKVSPLNELLDNRAYTYFLELELTALSNSGLRSVRIELTGQEAVTLTPEAVQAWVLADLTTSLPITTGDARRVVRICTNDLSHLANTTHYPSLVVDNKLQVLPSNACVDASGYNIELRRNLSTGPSSGTYQFLR
jgi:hypothetical protein